MDPKYFVAALTLRNLPKTVADQAELIASVGRNPSDERPQFALINGLLDEVHRQFLILMHVVPCDLLHPEVDNGIEKYEIRYGSEDAENVITGEFDGWMLYSRVKDMGLIEVFAKDKKVSLTKSGHDFAQWLVDSGRKARFMKTGYGGWGELIRKPSEEATDAHGSHSTSVRSTH